MSEAIVYVGVDVAKAYLDVVWEKRTERVPNDAAGRKQLVKWLGQIDGLVRVICEASGGYERGAVQALQNAGLMVSVVQASRGRQYARAAGILAKTDSIDARTLAKLAASGFLPEVWVADDHTRALRRQISRRSQLVRARTRAKNEIHAGAPAPAAGQAAVL